jgi:UTP--glucose-1-phosphate uridylyltransferase
MARLIGKQPFHGLRYEGQRFDCGDKIGYLEAQIAYALKRPDIADAVRTFLRHYVDPTDFIVKAVSRETVRS